ncbi:MAG TPA: zinc-binding alcohol dehydrogenase [Pyrinomonadaceae bacterium]|jgi:2-desacetyl-2-hydroxyethyl bacteriochlorophyllide A dehydrogenase
MKRRAVYFTAPRQVSVEEEPLPSPAADQVLVQTLVSAISAGTELLFYRGQAPADLPVDETISALAGDFNFPLKYGYAAVGRVAATGANVSPAWQGRLVFAFHPHESHFLSSPDELIPVPTGLSSEEAAFLPNMETAVNFLQDGRPLIGEQVLVFGQGVVGLLTTSLLARLPLAGLVTLDCAALRREKSLALGAQSSLDPEAPGVLAQLNSLLAVEGADAGADLSYELSGNPAALDLAIASTGFNGRVVIGSWYGQKRAALDLGGRFHRSRLSLVSSQVSTIAPQWSGRWNKSRRLRTAWQMLRQVRPGLLISHRFPVDRAPQAYDLLDRHPEETVQVILTYQS